jgi:hypothetical protein
VAYYITVEKLLHRAMDYKGEENGLESLVLVCCHCLSVCHLPADNIIAVKLIILVGFLVPAGIIIFPLSYLFGDVLTEVYGYGATRGGSSGWGSPVTCWR